jgi:hypothetical protein
MSIEERLRDTAAELDEALGVARDLHAGCCQPLRSPRMERLQTTLTRARDGVAGLGRSPIRPPIEDAGALLGSCRSPVAPRLASRSTPRHSGRRCPLG